MICFLLFEIIKHGVSIIQLYDVLFHEALLVRLCNVCAKNSAAKNPTAIAH